MEISRCRSLTHLYLGYDGNKQSSKQRGCFHTPRFFHVASPLYAFQVKPTISTNLTISNQLCKNKKKLEQFTVPENVTKCRHLKKRGPKLKRKGKFPSNHSFCPGLKICCFSGFCEFICDRLYTERHFLQTFHATNHIEPSSLR